MGKTLIIKGADFSSVAVGTTPITPSEPSEPTKATITLNVSPSGGGTVSGGGSYDIGSTVSISAVAASGYTFVRWNDGNTNATRNVSVSSNVTYTAIFEAEQEEPQILTPFKIAEGVMYYKGVDTPKTYGDGYYIYYFNVRAGKTYNVKTHMISGGDIKTPTGTMGNLICTVDADDNKIKNLQYGDGSTWDWDINVEVPETDTIIAVSVKSAEKNDDLVVVSTVIAEQ